LREPLFGWNVHDRRVPPTSAQLVGDTKPRYNITMALSRYVSSSRPRRYNIPAHAHALTFSCYRRNPLLDSEPARELTAAAIERAREKHRFHLWAYVLMPEHVHILILPLDQHYSISDILKSIKQSVSRRMIGNLKKRNADALMHVETGLARPKHRFWQDGGGYDRNCWSEGEIMRQIEYIYNNPVRRGLADKPDDWYWSSDW